MKKILMLAIFLSGFAAFGVNQTIWIAGGVSLAVGGIAVYISSKFKVQS